MEYGYANQYMSDHVNCVDRELINPYLQYIRYIGLA